MTIDLEDNDLLIKYPIYDPDDIFKKEGKEGKEELENEQKESVTEYKQNIFAKIINKIKSIFRK